MQTLNLFLLVAATIWFILFTVLANIQIAMELWRGQKIHNVNHFMFIMDLVVTSYLITRFIQWLF